MLNEQAGSVSNRVALKEEHVNLLNMLYDAQYIKVSIIRRWHVTTEIETPPLVASKYCWKLDLA